MSSPAEQGTIPLLLFFYRKFRDVGTKYKVELATSQLFTYISLLPPSLIPKTFYSNVRSSIEERLSPLKLPLAHVDTMKAKDAYLESFRLAGLEPPMPECWGHRGASAAFPENTIASFDRAIRDGSEGIESDVHITSDDVIIMFHDPSLDRTTDGKGNIREQAWEGGIEHLRTVREPRQQIPTFQQVCDLLMRPENQHVKLNIDIKADNNPDRLFRLMKKIVEAYPDYATKLSPRLILGLWHPVFLNSALEHVPTLRRVHIGGSPTAARTYFWKHCDGFSMWFPSLIGAEGQSFIQQARNEGKDVFVWTVNRRDEMIEATRWGVKAILTDKTDLFQDVRKKMVDDYVTTRSEQVGLFFRWGTWRYYMLPQFFIQALWVSELEKRAGISFKSAFNGEKAVQVQAQKSDTKEMAKSEVIQKASEKGATPTATSLLNEKAFGIPTPAVTHQLSTVAASA